MSVLQLGKLKVAFDFESFFDQDSTDKQFYNEHKKAFGYDNDYLLLIVESNEGLFNPANFAKLKGWQQSARLIEGVQSINSPLDLKRIVETPFGLTAFPLIHSNDSTKLKTDSAKIAKHPLFKQYFNFEQQAMLVSVEHAHFADKATEDAFLKELKLSLSQSEIAKYSLVGRLTAQATFVENIKGDFLLFSSLALVLSAILLWLIYRSFRLMLVPYLVSVTTMVFILGFMAFSNIPLSILSVLLPTIILFVSTSDAVHLLNAFSASNNSTYHIRLQEAVKHVLIPTFLTSITTAIGFLSLCFLPSQPINELGYLAALAIMLAFAINFVFAPLLLVQNKKARLVKLPIKGFTVWLFRKKIQVYSAFGTLLLVAVYFAFQLNTDAYLLKDLPENDPVRKQFELVDRHFGGSKPWELAIWPADSAVAMWSPAFMREVNKVTDFMSDSLAFGRVISPAELLKYANQVKKGGILSAYKFPEENIESTIVTAKKLNNYLNGKVINRAGNYARIVAFMPDWGAKLTTAKNESLQHFIAASIDQNIVAYQLTGTSYLIDKSNELVSLNLLKGLLMAVALIAIILGIYFKSLKLLLISLVPNLIPLLFTAGLMGIMQVPIKLTTTIIFVVAFSIAVDDTIHFISAYKRQPSKSNIWSTIRTFRLAGLSILITTLIIVSGFSLFVFSDFATTFYLGFFLAISLIFALLTDIFLLPLILGSKSSSATSYP